MVVPEAANSQSVARCVDTAPIRTLTVVPVASAICDASVRCQISRYSDSSCPLSSPCTCCGDRYGVLGLIASCASWAFFDFDEYCLGCGDRYCWPYSAATLSRVAWSASAESATLSVRMYVMKPRSYRPWA